MVTISRWLPKTYKSNGLFQKKSRQLTSGVGCWGHRFSRDIKERTCGNSRGQLKKKLKFQGCSWKTHVGKFHASLVFDLGISMRLWFLTLEFPPRSVTQFCRICRGESLLSKGKVIEFFSEKYIYLQPPCLEFFWNSPILIKGGKEYLSCPPPGYQDQNYLPSFRPYVLWLYIVINQWNLQIRQYHLFWWILQYTN